MQSIRQRLSQSQTMSQTQRVAQVAKDRALLEEQNWNQNTSEILSLPKRARDCDQANPCFDQSWRSWESKLIAAVRAANPRPQWRVSPCYDKHDDWGEHLEVLPIAGPTVKILVELPGKPSLYRRTQNAVLNLYIRHQREFVYTGNVSQLNTFRLCPQAEHEHELRQYGDDVWQKVTDLRPTTFLRRQFLYLPNGTICAADILHVTDRAEHDAFARVLQKEREMISSGGRPLSQGKFAELLSDELKCFVTVDEVRTLFEKFQVPSDSRKRKAAHDR